MRGYFGVGLEQSSKPMNAGNLFRTAHAFGANFIFTVNAEYSVKKAKSDTEQIPDNLKALEKKPEALNLLNIYSELSKNSLEKVLKEMSGKEYSFAKNKLADLLINEICPVGKEIKKLMGDKTHLSKILKKGAEKASIIAEENLKNIREKVGLI